jgi:hypothetical protein
MTLRHMLVPEMAAILFEPYFFDLARNLNELVACLAIARPAANSSQ